MLQKHSVEGFDDFKAKAEALAKEDVPLYVYFSGSKTSDGEYSHLSNNRGGWNKRGG